MRNVLRLADFRETEHAIVKRKLFEKFDVGVSMNSCGGREISSLLIGVLVERLEHPPQCRHARHSPRDRFEFSKVPSEVERHAAVIEAVIPE